MKYFSEHRVVGNSQLAANVSISHMYNLYGVRENGYAMGFEELKHDKFV